MYSGDYPVDVGVERSGAVEWRRTRLLKLVEGARPYVVVLAPQAADGTVLLQEGADALVFTNIADRGLGFLSTVGRRGVEADEKGARQAAVQLDLPEVFYWIQRRMFVRIKPPSILSCGVMPAGAEGPRPIDGFIDNISRGGAGIRLNTQMHALRDDLRAGDTAIVSIVFGDDAPVALGAHVLRIIEPRNQDQFPLIAVQWWELSPDDQRSLAGFLVGLERRILRKRRELDEGPLSPDGRRDWHPHVLPESPTEGEP